ncbi:MAG: glutamine--fructose-6-phosphate transaminase (isomerizing) [Nitrospirota bacterium]
MCGIIGYVGKRDAITVIVEGLRRLEYRGYDSAGVSFLSDGKIHVKRCKGKINDLSERLRGVEAHCTVAIGHTRWATHGKPSDENAHPHRSGGIVLVHNGIIENYHELKRSLEADGFVFTSETDTEVICHLVNKHSGGRTLEEAVRKALVEVRGAYAIAVMSEDEPGKVVAVRKDSPLVAGVGETDFFVASDIPAFLSYSRNVVFLEDDEMVVMTSGGIAFSNLEGEPLRREPTRIAWNASMAEKGGYKHFMLKEIFEQPRALADTIAGRVSAETGEVNLGEFHLTEELLREAEKLFIVACGTSWHAALVGKYLIEALARVPVEVDIASEFRYRSPIIGGKSLFVSITQSGETADTLAAQRLARKTGVPVLNVCNVIGSTSSREADAVFYTRSGPEVGVASTKAFTTQMAGLYLLAVAMGRARGVLAPEDCRGLVKELLAMPDKVETALQGEKDVEAISRELQKKNAFLYLGRGINYPIALEGALKLKEISYIHAEGYAAGEMKHGPIALIDAGYPVLFLAPRDGLYEKVISNMEEIRSRGGTIISVTTDTGGDDSGLAAFSLAVPEASPFLLPILFAVPLQLLAYHIGVLRGCDVDQPRNLAKSVTVE